MKCVIRVVERDGRKALEPAYPQDEPVYNGLKIGNYYRADFRKARNPDHHRKGFALINLIFDSQEKYHNIEDLLTELKLKVGWYREHVRENGDLVYIPKSLSFEQMDQTEFEKFYDRLVNRAINDYGLKEAMEFI